MPETGNANLDTKGDTNPQHGLGDWFDGPGGTRFRYVKYYIGSTAVTAAAGYGVFPIKENRYTVTRDYNASTTSYHAAVGKHKGYLQSVLADGKYGWIQTRGPNRQAMTASASTTGRNVHLVSTQAGNGTVTALAVGTADTNARYYLSGRSITADKSTTSTAFAVGTVDIDCEDQW